MTTQRTDTGHLADNDQIAAEYDAYVTSQRDELNQGLLDAMTGLQTAHRALLELIELDAPGFATIAADDAAHFLTDARRAVRALDRCTLEHLTEIPRQN